MKALVKQKAEPGLWLMDVPEPEYGPGDVLIKVLRTGICGTDLHIRAYDGWAQQAGHHPADPRPRVRRRGRGPRLRRRGHRGR
ncbi:L-threonine 3-dehydrogenase [Streptomyces microflavus]